MFRENQFLWNSRDIFFKFRKIITEILRSSTNIVNLSLEWYTCAPKLQSLKNPAKRGFGCKNPHRYSRERTFQRLGYRYTGIGTGTARIGISYTKAPTFAAGAPARSRPRTPARRPTRPPATRPTSLPGRSSPPDPDRGRRQRTTTASSGSVEYLTYLHRIKDKMHRGVTAPR